MSYSEMSSKTFFWVLQGLCALHRKPFSLELARQQLPAPYTQHALCAALAEYELQADTRALALENLPTESFPLIAWLHPNQEFGAEHATGDERDSALSPALLLQADGVNVLFVEQSDATPRAMLLAHFLPRYSGKVTSVIPQPQAVAEAEPVQAKPFGFAWFVPELLKHRKLWQEIVLASLVLQLIALATPLFTQAIIDKVVVHRTESTLIVIAIGMLVFMSFSAVLSWLRQYLVLHTGNRVDAALGAAVFARLFKLPPLYFQHRATGVIAARLQGIETIREFIASAAMTLVLDLPFLLIFVAIMFYYNVNLTLLVLAMLGLIVGLSLMVAPLFQTRLQHQFQLGARNQAFVTEYISGLETVKSLQLEPVLNRRYSGFLSSYLQAGFATRQLANTYNTFANLLEQMMGVLILTLGAYSVMQQPQFTIGMLVAFQMFSGRLSQPMLRLVGLWQQFQQARLSLARLGDLMNAPIEPYAMQPARGTKKVGRIEIEQLAFKYAEHLPLVYQSLNLTVEQGQVIALMGASGSGKSTLAKLLQGFYQPSAGRILLNGVDIRYLSANELRSYFGVVPQETTLFSGTIYDNLHMTNPEASFEQIIAACEMAEIHQTIEALPQGYQTEIGERGAGLSGGQKQRIAIARALLKRPSILIFDEATSALDATTAEQFAQTINALRGKVTIIFIAHGLPKGLSVDALYRIGQHGAQQLTSSNASFRATVPAAPVHPHMPPAQAVSSISP